MSNAYGSINDSGRPIAVAAPQSAAPFLLVMVLPAIFAALIRRSRVVAIVAAGLVVLTVVAVPCVAAVGIHVR